MFLAPTPPIESATLVHYASGVAGIWQTLRVMRRMVREAKTDPRINQAAISATFLTPEKNRLHEVSALFDFVRDHVRYVQDVYDVETVAHPVLTLQRMIGDCDDQVTFLAALCETLGYQTRFVVAGYSHPDVFEHVYLQVCVDGEWISADPTERAPLGWEPPGAVVTQYEKV